MDTHTITQKIKEIIAEVADLDTSEIEDRAHFIDDLQLDSLSLLEIGVDVDYEFKLGAAEERLSKLRTIPETVLLVEEILGARAAA